MKIYRLLVAWCLLFRCSVANAKCCINFNTRFLDAYIRWNTGTICWFDKSRNEVMWIATDKCKMGNPEGQGSEQRLDNLELWESPKNGLFRHGMAISVFHSATNKTEANDNLYLIKKSSGRCLKLYLYMYPGVISLLHFNAQSKCHLNWTKFYSQQNK